VLNGGHHRTSGRGRPLSYLACILVYIACFWDRVDFCSHFHLLWFTLAIESFSLVTFGDIKIISVALDQPRVDIFQVFLFRTTYFHDLWTLPSTSTSMEGTGHLGMAMPLSTIEVVYSIVQQASVEPDPTPAQDLDPILEPIWAQGSLTTTYSLDLVLPSNEAIIEVLTGLDRPWDDLHHRSYFLPELRRIEVGEFVLTMTGDRSCPINPLAMHTFYVEGNMASIAETIPIDSFRTLGVVENVFVEADCSPEEIHIYTDLFKEIHDIFAEYIGGREHLKNNIRYTSRGLCPQKYTKSSLGT
jgi:hypothetical protein